LNVTANATIGATLGVGGLLTTSGGILSTKQIKIIGDTANTSSIYQWEDATYRNPGQHTPELLVRSDNSSVGIGAYRPAAVLYNHIGKEGATVGLTFAFRETETTGNSVMIASIVGYKEIAGNNNAWSSGGLRFLTKNLGTLTEAMTITSAGRVGIGTTAPEYLLHTNGRGYF